MNKCSKINAFEAHQDKARVFEINLASFGTFGKNLNDC